LPVLEPGALVGALLQLLRYVETLACLRQSGLKCQSDKSFAGIQPQSIDAPLFVMTVEACHERQVCDIQQFDLLDLTNPPRCFVGKLVTCFHLSSDRVHDGLEIFHDDLVRAFGLRQCVFILTSLLGPFDALVNDLALLEILGFATPTLDWDIIVTWRCH